MNYYGLSMISCGQHDENLQAASRSFYVLARHVSDQFASKKYPQLSQQRILLR